jgi:uncharacterized protein (TIGR03086 family)
MTASDPFALLARALDQTGSVIAHTKPDQASLPSPCSGWDLRTLVNHTAYDAHMFATMVTGAERPSPDVDLIDDDWAAAFRRESDALLATWRERGADGTIKTRIGELPATWAIGQHLADIAVHAWDIARASNQPTDLDPEIGQAALDWAHQNLKPEYRGAAFGFEVSVPETAPLYDRLAGFFGRNPQEGGRKR